MRGDVGHPFPFRSAAEIATTAIDYLPGDENHDSSASFVQFLPFFCMVNLFFLLIVPMLLVSFVKATEALRYIPVVVMRFGCYFLAISQPGFISVLVFFSWRIRDHAFLPYILVRFFFFSRHIITFEGLCLLIPTGWLDWMVRE